MVQKLGDCRGYSFCKAPLPFRRFTGSQSNGRASGTGAPKLCSGYEMIGSFNAIAQPQAGAWPLSSIRARALSTRWRKPLQYRIVVNRRSSCWQCH